jgi:hypothetical protein
MRSFDWTDKETQVPEVKAIVENANDVYRNMKHHPLILLAYRDNCLNAYEKQYSEYCTGLFDEAQKIEAISDKNKNMYLLKKYEKKVALEVGLQKQFFQGIISDMKGGKDFSAKRSQLPELKKKYFDSMKADIKAQLAGQSVEKLITGMFSENMQKVCNANKDQVIMH